MKTFADILVDLGACENARAWVGERDGETAWRECERGDWLLWLAARTGVDRRAVISAACAVARETLVHVPAGEERPRVAIETAERWTRGEATTDEVHAAASAANAVAYAAYAAANAAVNAAVNAATHAAYAAAYAAASAAAYAADFADNADAARAASLRRSADIVRQHISWEQVEAAQREVAV